MFVYVRAKAIDFVLRARERNNREMQRWLAGRFISKASAFIKRPSARGACKEHLLRLLVSHQLVMCSAISHTQRNISRMRDLDAALYTRTRANISAIDPLGGGDEFPPVHCRRCHVHAQYWSLGQWRPTVHELWVGSSEKEGIGAKDATDCTHIHTRVPLQPRPFFKFIANCGRGRINKYVDAPLLVRVADQNALSAGVNYWRLEDAKACASKGGWQNICTHDNITWWVVRLPNRLDNLHAFVKFIVKIIILLACCPELWRKISGKLDFESCHAYSFYIPCGISRSAGRSRDVYKTFWKIHTNRLVQLNAKWTTAE